MQEDPIRETKQKTDKFVRWNFEDLFETGQVKDSIDKGKQALNRLEVMADVVTAIRFFEAKFDVTFRSSIVFDALTKRTSEINHLKNLQNFIAFYNIDVHFTF